MYPYIVIDRPGYYGRQGRVYSRHRTLSAALVAAKRCGYTDERGLRRSTAIVGRNDGDRYRAGDTFWADMPPAAVTA